MTGRWVSDKEYWEDGPSPSVTDEVEAVSMSANDVLLLIFGGPIAAILGGLADRRVQRWMWKLDKPYAERLEAIKAKRS